MPYPSVLFDHLYQQIISLTAAAITDSLMKNRFSCRYFLPRPVAKELVEEIIDAARYAPSGNNMQPWEKVYCLSGDVLKAVSTEMVQAHITCPETYKAQYDYYPTNPLPEEYAIRRREFGKRFYGSLNVDHNDSAGTAAALTKQYEFFGAPVVFVFTINQALTQGSWMDLGYFLQSVTIAARARGLETTSQVSTAKFQLILRKHLPIKDTEVVALGMSMGYPDLEKVAQYYARQPKREVADIIEFHGL
ncbi:nitroreductase [Dendrothele bispora CBS 962.96]|uniref:Nitroreductase n=1 Tax=Dendrothele bispora (strain CBS 962.96) TaxID=1314807 RepID=A0A4S8LU55_DENBC|nr:nitroreductase [Dendrothele bispora CBS 962.96]